jgi:hypothetical protein
LLLLLVWVAVENSAALAPDPRWSESSVAVWFSVLEPLVPPGCAGVAVPLAAPLVCVPVLVGLAQAEIEVPSASATAVESSVLFI